ncbi:MAG TPA: ankyrin repeat domain-containing protein, partial [Achromobacter sp.]|uniref:ankyrin repeat domain-containing protein n=1 Tax=Achromobacter sp. TaxID=134375 RepID=UPI002F933488
AAAAASEGVKTDPTWVEPSRAETGARQAPKPCDCDSPYREYKEANTPPAAALFAALDTSDETAFLAALAQVDRPGDYALDGVPLLHALLMPPRALRAPEVYWSMTAEDTARIRTAHQAILPARTRMLAALQATKPALDDVTYSSRRPPLHLALLYGTPAIMDLLLAAGADPTAKRQGYDAKSAVDVAVQAGDVATLRQFADAGFDLKTLGAGAIRQALENREGALALMLIEAGVPVDSHTGGPGKTDDAGDAGGRAEPPLLLAVTSGQAAVVDALLSRGADPAGLASDGESALYWLIGRQDTAMLDRLLRAGAKLDDLRLPRAPAPYALLNAAVASGDMALVKRVSQATGQAVADACLPEGGEFNLLDKPGYFAQLQAAGFTGKPNACARDAAPLPQRIVSQLLHSRQLIVARHATVVQLLRQLKASGADLDAPQADGATPLNVAIQLGRQDLADALLSAGASPDSVDAAGRTPAGVARETGQPAMRMLLERHGARVDDIAAPAIANKRGGAKASSKSAAGLPGHYWLRGMREVGSEILLSEDGRFDYMMTYGAVDIVARGTWRSDGRQVFLDTPPIVPFSAIAGVRADTRPAESNQLTVRVYYRDRPVKVDVAMSSADADYGGGPRQSEGSDGVSAPIAPGALKALAVFVPLPSGARWHEVDVSKIDPGARAIRVDVAVPESATGTPLHKTFTLHKDGALVESSGSRELRYEKE